MRHEHQLDALDVNLIENNQEECSYPPPPHKPSPPPKKKMISGETMRCHKVRPALQYHVPNRLSLQKNLLIRRCFYFIHSEMKKNCYQAFHQCIKTNCKRRDSRML